MVVGGVRVVSVTPWNYFELHTHRVTSIDISKASSALKTHTYIHHTLDPSHPSTRAIFSSLSLSLMVVL